MDTKKNKKETEEHLDNFLEDDYVLSFNEIPSHSHHTWITGTTTQTQTINTGSISYTSDSVVLVSDGSDWVTTTIADPYAEIEEWRLDQEKDEKLREEYPCLQEAYDNYLLIRKLLQDEECDKYFEDRMRVFRK